MERSYEAAYPEVAASWPSDGARLNDDKLLASAFMLLATGDSQYRCAPQPRPAPALRSAAMAAGPSVAPLANAHFRLCDTNDKTRTCARTANQKSIVCRNAANEYFTRAQADRARDGLLDDYRLRVDDHWWLANLVRPPAAPVYPYPGSVCTVYGTLMLLTSACDHCCVAAGSSS